MESIAERTNSALHKRLAPDAISTGYRQTRGSQI